MSSFKCDLCLNEFVEQFSFFEHLKEHYGLGDCSNNIRTTSNQNITANGIANDRISTGPELGQKEHPNETNSSLEVQSVDCNNCNATATITTLTPVIDIPLTNSEIVESSNTNLETTTAQISSEPSVLLINNRRQSPELITSAQGDDSNSSDAVANKIASIIEKIEEVKAKVAATRASTATSTSSLSTIVNEENELCYISRKYVCPCCTRTFKREKKYHAHIIICCPKEDLIVTAPGDENDGSTAANPITNICRKSTEVEEIDLYPNNSSANFISEQDDNEDEDDPLPEDLIDNEVTNEIIQKINKQVQLLANGHVCIICDATFTSKVKLDVHLRKIHPEITRATRKKKHEKGQAKEEVLKCGDCDRVFNHRNSLVYHMRSHTGERPHQCDSCGKSFFATSALRVHQRLHTGDKPFKCDTCGRNFRQWGDLKYHVISIHSNVRSYQCEFCGKDFARKYSLIVHRRIHTGERNYKCEYCGKSFRAASYLQNHRRIHTGEKPHSCVICAKPFRVRSDMKRHMASHNRESSQNQNNRSTQSTISNTPTDSLDEAAHVPNVITLNGFSSNQIVTIGSQQLSIREGDTIQVSMLTDGRLTLDQAQQLGIDVSQAETITGDINSDTPMLTLTSSDGTTRTLEGSIETTVTSVDSTELADSVLYSTRDGTVETVAIRENNTGTLYVWPVYMN